MHDLLRTLTADISPSAKLLATALYAHAPASGDLPVADVLGIVGLRTTGALRHLRSELAAADILATSITDGALSWQFLSPSQPRAARPTDALTDPERVPQTRSTADSASQPRAARPTDALTDPERVPQTRSTADSASQPRAARPTDALTDPERVPQTRSTADSASQPRAARPTDALTDPVTPVTPPTARPTDALAPPQIPPRQVGSLINLNQENNLPTPLPPTAPEQQRSIRLLRAIGVNANLAARIAARWGFREVCAFVAVYLADHAAGKCNGAGVLQGRCLDPDSAAPHLAANAPELTGVLLSQHITAADRAAWRAADESSQRQAEFSRYAVDEENMQYCADPEPQPDTRAADFAETMLRRLNVVITADPVDLAAGYITIHAPLAEDRAKIAEHHILVRNLAFRHFDTHTFQVEP